MLLFLNDLRFFSQTSTNVKQDLTIAMIMLTVQTRKEVTLADVRLVLMEMASFAKVRSSSQLNEF